MHETEPIQWPFKKDWGYLNSESLPLQQCLSCSFGFTGKLPPSWFFEQVVYNPVELEAPTRPSDQPGGKEYVFDHALKVFRANGVTGPLLDIGCGNGRFLFRAKEQFGGKIEGIELHHRDAEMARSFGFKVHEGNVKEILTNLSGRFGLVTMIDVLEHLTEPGQKLRELSAAIRPGGHLYIKVPHLYGQLAKEKLRAGLRRSRTSMMTNFAHVNHFSEPSLCRALKKLSFEIISAGPSPSDFNTVKSFRGSPRSYGEMALRVGFFKLTQAVRTAVPVNAGMHLEVLARRLN